MMTIQQFTSDNFRGVKTLAPVAFTENRRQEREVLNIYPEVTYQTVLGFGGAFTEASAYCYAKLSPAEKERLLRAYFSPEGLGYSLCRTHINSCDFALDRYVYVEDGDETLETFSIARDKQYIIPFIKDALTYTGKSMMLFASPWSAPAWMKTNDSVIGGGRIKPAYLDVWANYYCKYIQAFAEEGIAIDAISVQNEPMAIQTWESCEYTAEEEGLFIREHLAPALAKAGLAHVKIIIWDHNKERIYDRARDTFAIEGVRDLVWGIGFHWYSGVHFDAVGVAAKAFPEKMLIETEYCKVLDGRYEAFGFDNNPLSYAIELHGNFLNGMHGSVDWNMLLDLDGGPYHDRKSGCRAPVMVDTKRGIFHLSEIYYNIYHYAHFIQSGAVRVGSSSFSEEVLLSAFRNPDGTLVAVAVHKGTQEQIVHVRVGNEMVKVTLAPQSVSTFIIQ